MTTNSTAQMTLAPGREDAFQAAEVVHRQTMAGTQVWWWANRWACAMQVRLQNGKPLAEVWMFEAIRADPPGCGIDGYTAAVLILSRLWLHGPELRRLHNDLHEVPGRTSAERATAAGWVLDPKTGHKVVREPYPFG